MQGDCFPALGTGISVDCGGGEASQRQLLEWLLLWGKWESVHIGCAACEAAVRDQQGVSSLHWAHLSQDFAKWFSYHGNWVSTQVSLGRIVDLEHTLYFTLLLGIPIRPSMWIIAIVSMRHSMKLTRFLESISPQKSWRISVGITWICIYAHVAMWIIPSWR